MTLGYVTHVLAIREVCGWLVGAGSFVCWLALALALKLISFPFFILVFVFFNLGFRPGSLVVLRHPRLCRWLRLRGAVCRWPRPWRPPRPTFCLAGFFFFFSFLVIFLCFGSFSLSRPALGVSALACRA